MNLRPHTLSLRIGVALALGFTAAVSAGEPIEKRAPADPKGVVEIVNVAGSVRVMGWNRAEVEVRGELDDNAERLDFSTEGPRTVIRVVLPRNRNNSGDSDLVVRIPEASALTMNTISADQEIDGVKGAQRLQSVSGLIHSETGGEDFQAKTISGDILIAGVSGAKPAIHTVTTVSGDLTLSKISGEVDVETVSGDMTIEAGELSRARVRTTNGDMELSMKLASNGRLDAETINGEVTLKILGTVDAEFDIHTFNGEIASCYGEEAVRSRERGPGHDLNFTRGSGSARVRIKTLNGGIDLCGK
jgi:Putative adhesin